MSCLGCARRSTCRSPCSDLSRELAEFERPLEEVLVPVDLFPDQPDDPSADGWSSMRRSRRDRKSVAEIVASLTERQRRILYLSYVDLLSTREIAKLMRLSRRTVRIQLERARGTLKKKFRQRSLDDGKPTAADLSPTNGLKGRDPKNRKF